MGHATIRALSLCVHRRNRAGQDKLLHLPEKLDILGVTVTVYEIAPAGPAIWDNEPGRLGHR
jgi:hypothetical protein